MRRSPTTSGDHSGLVGAHVERDLGRTGVRVVELTCLADGEATVSYDLVHAWAVDGAVCRSLFCVGDRSPLGGTTVLFRERAFEPVEMWHWLPTSSRVRALEPFRVHDRVLGSDFVYDDFRMWTPEVVQAADRWQADGDVLRLSGRCAWGRGDHVECDARVDLCTGLLTRASWTAAGAREPFRDFEVAEITDAGGVSAPVLMRVTRPEYGYESRMQLRSQRIDVDLRGGLLTPDRLQAAREHVLGLADAVARR